MPKNSEPDARAAALRLLTRREHAAGELLRKLEQRGIEREEAREVIAELSQAGWQSDARYASEYAHAHAARGDGPLKIRAALQAQGVAQAQIEEALAGLEIDWLERACQVRTRHFGPELPSAPAELARQVRFLQNRGFPSSMAYQAVKTAVFHQD